MPHASKYETAAVIVAAGKGQRFDTEEKKQFSTVLGHPVIAWTVNAFSRTFCINHIVIVAQEEDISVIKNEIMKRYSFFETLQFIGGGASRRESVYNGIASLAPEVGWVAIHDGVRLAITPELITAVCNKAHGHGAAMLAIPATDSTFIASGKTIDKYLDRNSLWQAQTPQVFEKNKILEAHQKARHENFHADDDGILYRRYIGEVHIVQGDDKNIKITYPGDLITAEKILKERQDYPE
ncbi:hypothetical protein AMJ80_07845 [bacterium SM23_31]|nr:MAG: hypothetical protein AMJ80_07845 [bacterium SM23_31]